MIKLTKHPKPAILVENEKKWTDEYLVALKLKEKNKTKISTTLLGKYKHDEIKKKLIEECYGKCMYCESKIEAVYPGDVEHILPKSHFPELRYTWHNLGFACFECNNKKRDYYEENNAIINPYTENPTDFFIIYGDKIWAIPNHTRAFITVKMLQLNRLQLIEKRKQKIEGLHELIENYAKETNAIAKRLRRQTIEMYIAESEEYSSFTKAFKNKMMEVVK